jgi:hypothetical protein
MEADGLLRSRRARPRFLVARGGPVERLLRLTLLDHTLDVRIEEPPGRPFDGPAGRVERWSACRGLEDPGGPGEPPSGRSGAASRLGPPGQGS